MPNQSMNIALSSEALSLVVDALEKTHRELVRKAESWSFDLEGDFDNYVKARQEELNVAVVINSIKKQRTFRENNPQGAGVPLADWEIELLTGGRN